MGQVTNAAESERRGLRFALDAARRDNNEQAVRELEGLGAYATPERPMTLPDLYLQRKWLGYYGGAVYGRKSFSHESAAARLAPEYSDNDVRALWKANDFSEERLLLGVIGLDYSGYVRFGCPIILFNGRHDYNVSATAAAEWFDKVRAPSKALVWFEHSAHEMFNEEPGKMLVSLVRYARPIAEKAGDVAP
jgi:pimeloyl-ACP methyl ester carboxylesterase